MLLVNFRVSRAQYRYLKQLASEQDKTLSEIIRDNLPEPKQNYIKIEKGE